MVYLAAPIGSSNNTFLIEPYVKIKRLKVVIDLIGVGELFGRIAEKHFHDARYPRAECCVLSVGRRWANLKDAKGTSCARLIRHESPFVWQRRSQRQSRDRAVVNGKASGDVHQRLSGFPTSKGLPSLMSGELRLPAKFNSSR